MKRLTKSNEDYLEAILILSENGNNVKSVDIARLLGVSKPAVNKAMNDLKNNGLIDKDSYTDIALTKKGHEIASRVYQKHLLIKRFLIQIGVSPKVADHDCCLIEHVISEETFEALTKFVEKKT